MFVHYAKKHRAFVVVADRQLVDILTVRGVMQSL